MLLYCEVSSLFPYTSGYDLRNFFFRMVSIDASVQQKMGLFIPLSEDKGKVLSTAIQNGAVAAVWEKNTPLPASLPIHFPVFFVSNPLKAFLQIAEVYMEKIEKEMEDNVTHFVFYTNNNEKKTYDLACKNERALLRKTINIYREKTGRG